MRTREKRKQRTNVKVNKKPHQCRPHRSIRRNELLVDTRERVSTVMTVTCTYTRVHYQRDVKPKQRWPQPLSTVHIEHDHVGHCTWPVRKTRRTLLLPSRFSCLCVLCCWQLVIANMNLMKWRKTMTQSRWTRVVSVSCTTTHLPTRSSAHKTLSTSTSVRSIR